MGPFFSCWGPDACRSIPQARNQYQFGVGGALVKAPESLLLSCSPIPAAPVSLHRTLQCSAHCSFAVGVPNSPDHSVARYSDQEDSPMYTWECLNRIRRMEALLYAGPETVEQVFERDDRFSNPHARARQSSDSDTRTDTNYSDCKEWYCERLDPATGKLVCEVREKPL